MRYKGYTARIQYDESIQEFHGRIVGIQDVVNFHADTVKNLESEFHRSVEDYLQSCRELNREPDRPYSGKFLIRVEPRLHREMAMIAESSGKSLNDFVAEIFEERLRSRNAKSSIVS